jgi:hypothetical protein
VGAERRCRPGWEQQTTQQSAAALRLNLNPRPKPVKWWRPYQLPGDLLKIAQSMFVHPLRKDLMENINSQQFVGVRKKTRSVAQSEIARAQEYLAILSPLTRPASLLGDLISGGAKAGSQTASKGVAEFTSLYRQVASAKPFNDDVELRTPLEVASTQVEFHPFQYRYTIAGPDGKKVVTVITPLKWTMNYSGYALSGLRAVLAQRDAPQESVRRFLIHTALLSFVITHQPGLVKILEGLRYQLATTTLPEFGALPVPYIAFSVPTVRPSDEVILEMTELSGVDQIEEVLDADAVSDLRDPLREQLLAALGGVNNGAQAAA